MSLSFILYFLNPALASLLPDVRLCKDSFFYCLPQFWHNFHTLLVFAVSPVFQDLPKIIAVGQQSALLSRTQVQIILGC